MHTSIAPLPLTPFRYAISFCASRRLSLSSVREGLRLLEAAVGSLESGEFALLRERVQTIYYSLCS
ncbi:hypothetical protein EON64_13090, partial [archaeon]